MKIYPEKYPMGTLPYQKTPGRYVDEYLVANLEPLARNIVNDMQFMGLCCSSTFEVRTGKSTFLQQMGETWNYLIEKNHGIKLDLTMKNVVFKSEDLMKRAFELPKYSFLILDENDEVDEHYFSQLAKTMRSFFKKSGQLNLFIMIVVPNFFQLRSSYAMGRTIFLIDVKFKGEFERGHFAFYSFDKKKKLYLDGKKTQNYKVVPPDFEGVFKEGYVVDKRQYLDHKRRDLEEVKKIKPFDERAVTIKHLKRFREKLPKITIKQLAEGFGVHENTIYNYLSTDDIPEEPQVETTTPESQLILNNNIKKNILAAEK